MAYKNYQKDKDAPRKSVYDIVTERFMEQLQKGIIPWRKPWVSISGKRVGAWGHKNGTPYSILNQMMLPLEGEYLTFKQIKEEGGRLKKGSKGSIIVYWDSFETTVKNTQTNVDEDKRIPFLKYYTVFHISDCEGITQKFQPDDIQEQLSKLTEPAKCKKADSVVKKYLEESGVTLRHVADVNNASGAYYSPNKDEVVMPLKKQFNGNKAEYYSALFHELVHSTGHRDRLNRLGTSIRVTPRGKNYALEELVAEVGACASLYELGIETNDSIMNSNAYLENWLIALSNDHHMIVKAATRAQKAVRYIFNGADGVTPCQDVKPVDYSEPTVPDEETPF